MQNPFPPSRVLVSQQVPNTFEVSKQDTYENIYTDEERSAIINKYKTPNLFNGSCVRLDNIQSGVGYLSPVSFYDFLCCNIVGFHNKDDLAWPKLQQRISKYGELDSFEKVLRIKELPNIIGVSVLLHDINNDYLLVERNTAVSVGSGLFACSASGSMGCEDLVYYNPIVGCATRELKEELNLKCNLYVQSIVMPIQKMQPIALLTGVVSRPWRELIPYMIKGEDFSLENSRLLVVPKDKLLSIISLYKFTDAASYHIYIEAGGNKRLWKEHENSIVKLSDYYIK